MSRHQELRDIWERHREEALPRMKVGARWRVRDQQLILPTTSEPIPDSVTFTFIEFRLESRNRPVDRLTEFRVTCEGHTVEDRQRVQNKGIGRARWKLVGQAEHIANRGERLAKMRARAAAKRGATT